MHTRTPAPAYESKAASGPATVVATSASSRTRRKIRRSAERCATPSDRESIYYLRSPSVRASLTIMFASMLVSPATPVRAMDGSLSIVGGSATLSMLAGRTFFGVAFSIGVEGADVGDATILLAVADQHGKQVGDPIKVAAEALVGRGVLAKAMRVGWTLPKGDNSLMLVVNGETVARCRLETT